MISALRHIKYFKPLFFTSRHFTANSITGKDGKSETKMQKSVRAEPEGSGNRWRRVLFGVGIAGIGLTTAGYFVYRKFKKSAEADKKVASMEVVAKKIISQLSEELENDGIKESSVLPGEELFLFDSGPKPNFEKINKLPLNEVESLAAQVQKKLNKLNDDFSFYVKVEEFSKIRINSENVFSLDASKIIDTTLIERQLKAIQRKIKRKLQSTRQTPHNKSEELVTLIRKTCRQIHGILLLLQPSKSLPTVSLHTYKKSRSQ
eukprot:TRINITY_DN931_c0_g3_i6.p1 TRINITY_DN931_c0_g3~~TRINITY_DN931_c0_g3_i6.p1  ORF type:complete len:262 (-),score=24.29 TRINITY_DN931_c0_g3_i6:151-936(-)